MKILACRWCGKEFEPQQTAQKYCPACRADPDITRARARERKQRQLERKNNRYLLPHLLEKPTKTCLICGAPFAPTGNRQKWCPNHRKEGRREARARYMRKYRREKKNPRTPQV